MVTINYDPRALEDLKLIYDFLNRNSPSYARSTIKKIKDRVKILKKFPKIGRMVPEIERPEYREPELFRFISNWHGG